MQRDMYKPLFILGKYWKRPKCSNVLNSNSVEQLTECPY